ncbi:helix-turn-helix domain-containing protein [Streptomyces atriruber]|uniref:helix-turn-helix domain-containing protein n=1 Tax=Streptomyces atriruber TaxID=545121 RepID=UPI0006E45A94|nr:helix-turn-helix domain-containing protein [Streptomyces atriruber]
MVHHTARLPDLLRAWRATAGKKLQRGKPLPQKEVAERMEVSERWYRNLESDARVPLTPDALTRLSAALALGPDERLALYGNVHAHADPAVPDPHDDGEPRCALAELLATQEQFPAYLVDRSWDILDHTGTMATWFPWVLEPGANLLRWVLTSAEAREQLTDWPAHAAVYLAQLRFALVTSRGEGPLAALLDEVLDDHECRSLWGQDLNVIAYRQGHRFRLRLPHVSAEEITVTSQVLLPAYRQELRYVLLLPTNASARQAGTRIQPQSQPQAQAL